MIGEIFIHNFTKTGEKFGISLRAWLQEELTRVGVEFVPACGDSPCLDTPNQTLRQGITLLSGLIAAQQVVIDDLTARIEVLENP